MPVRDCVIDIINLVMRKTNYSSTLDVYKQSILQYFQSHGFDFEEEPVLISAKTIEILANIVFAKRHEL